MLFLEFENPELYLEELKAKQLTKKYKGVKLKELVQHDWGSEFFVHDPSNVLWHVEAC
jgi:hypothetical protein